MLGVRLFITSKGFPKSFSFQSLSNFHFNLNFHSFTCNNFLHTQKQKWNFETSKVMMF
jgi:hypothetical protein